MQMIHCFAVTQKFEHQILGPLLSLLHENDMYQAVDCDLSLYADDSFCFMNQFRDVKAIKDTGHLLSSFKKNSHNRFKKIIPLTFSKT